MYKKFIKTSVLILRPATKYQFATYFPSTYLVWCVFRYYVVCNISFNFPNVQIIWLLNPCHLISMLQIILLILPVNLITAGLYR